MKQHLLNTILFLGGSTLMALGYMGGDFLYSFFGGVVISKAICDMIVPGEVRGFNTEEKKSNISASLQNLLSGISFMQFFDLAFHLIFNVINTSGSINKFRTESK